MTDSYPWDSDPELVAWRLYDILIDNLSTLCSVHRAQDSLALWAACTYVDISPTAVLLCAPRRVRRRYRAGYVDSIAALYRRTYGEEYLDYLVMDVWKDTVL